ncbi:unnamed protein product [Vitrella brassicaformis CCMP3155]|uniref:Uncharacterized protein n=1 Tax=Vitrella brassicaformis (strain CCMP3155) TaxID=1169540 RepID=A0A0G4H3E6_VITBC|nr:unnamed protein product [Vitrella brassicaformis CCMP3155]|mmetsp:Transcript_49569/g.124283  ORF Transcript_49569/g.124283 Transcript_49569/m.124283 type:complete len:187 (-) Transcript_49569:494-1054(-)|eukprot:CEM38235.1 unnamed protein product [Vitrella brassicaformis CCMP3155]
MGKQRGFQAGGIPNPMVVNRRKILPSGPSMMERLQRESRPSWDDFKKIVHKKDATSSEALEKWENENYRDELEKFRDVKISKQEKKELRRIRKEAKKQSRSTRKKDKGGDRDRDRDRDRDGERKRKRDDSSDDSRSDSDSDSSSSSGSSERRRRRKKAKKAKKEKKNHPYKLSNFLRSGEDDKEED